MPKITIEELKQKINERDAEKGLVGSAYIFKRELAVEKDREENVSDDEKQFLEMTISSETPIEDWFGYLILEHTEQAIIADRLKTGAAFRDGHNGDQVGVIVNHSITDKRQLKIGVNFSPHNPRAVMLYKEYRDRYRKNSSVRFVIHDLVLERTVEDTDYYRATKWEFIHGAGVADGADNNVGMDRNLNRTNNQINKRSNNMTPEELAAKETAAREAREAADRAAKEKEIQIKADKDREVLLIKERAKVNLKPEQANMLDRIHERGGSDAVLNAISILDMARTYKEELKNVDLPKLADDYIKLGTSERKFGDMITDMLANKAQNASTQSMDGLSQRDRNSFSIAKLANSVVPGTNLDISREVGMIREYEEQNGLSLKSKHGGVVIPYAFLYEKQRTLTAASNTQAGALIGTNLLASEFIPLPRNRSVVDQLGVRVLPNLVQNQAIPVQTAAGTVSWMADEITPPSATDLTLGQKTLTPKTAKTAAAFTRLASLQSTPAIEQIAVDDILSIIALARDKAFHHGAGSGSNEPAGIEVTDGVGLGTVDTSFTYADIIAMETSLGANNLDVESAAYVTNATLRGILKGTEKATGYPVYLWDNNMMNGYKALASNQIDTGFLFFGDYSKGVIGEWGGVELVFNPYAYDGAIVKVSAYLTMDVVLRYAKAFAFYKPE